MRWYSPKRAPYSPDYMTPQSEIKLFDSYDEGWVAEHKTEITNLFSEHMETSMD